MTTRMKYHLVIGVEVACPDGWAPLVLPAVKAGTQMDQHWRRLDDMQMWADARRRRLLTPREIEVVRLVAEGRTSQQVARELGCSVRTVHTHMANLIRGLGATSRTHAVVLAIRAGLIPLDPAEPADTGTPGRAAGARVLAVAGAAVGAGAAS